MTSEEEAAKLALISVLEMAWFVPSDEFKLVTDLLEDAEYIYMYDAVYYLTDKGVALLKEK